MKLYHNLRNGMFAELGRDGAKLEGTLMVRENEAAADYELYVIENDAWEFSGTSKGVPDLSDAWEDSEFLAWAAVARETIKKERA